jgi:hypothetical protein
VGGAADAPSTVVGGGEAAPDIIAVLGAGGVVVTRVVIAYPAVVYVGLDASGGIGAVGEAEIIVGWIVVADATRVDGRCSFPEARTVLEAGCVVIGRVSITHAAGVAGGRASPGAEAVSLTVGQPRSATNTAMAVVFVCEAGGNTGAVDDTGEVAGGSSHAIAARVEKCKATEDAIAV